MTIYEHAAASSPLHDAAPPAPWMPLEPLMDLWAAFGRVASSTEGLRATSQAFAALADERKALHELHQFTPAYFPQRARHGAWDRHTPTPFETQEVVIASLQQASTHWFEAACSLLAEIALSHLKGRTPPPPDLDMNALLSYTLCQRERVWTIAHSLLTEQVRPSRLHGKGGLPDLPGTMPIGTPQEGVPPA